MNKLLFLLPYLLSLGITTSIFFYAWRHRHVRGASVYTWYVAGQALWGLGYIIELISPELDQKIFWDQFQWIAGFFILIAFPVFAFKLSLFILFILSLLNLYYFIHIQLRQLYHKNRLEPRIFCKFLLCNPRFYLEFNIIFPNLLFF